MTAAGGGCFRRTICIGLVDGAGVSDFGSTFFNCLLAHGGGADSKDVGRGGEKAAAMSLTLRVLPVLGSLSLMFVFFSLAASNW